MTVEEKFQLYFPGREIPVHALQEVKIFDSRQMDIDYSTTLIRPVSLARIVGTNNCQSNGFRSYRWVDALSELNITGKGFRFRSDDISTLLDLPLDDIELIQFYHTNEFCIFRGSDHRIALHKLSGKDFVQAKVTKATFKPVITGDAYLKNEIKRESNVISEALTWFKFKLSGH